MYPHALTDSVMPPASNVRTLPYVPLPYAPPWAPVKLKVTGSAAAGTASSDDAKSADEH